MVSTLGSILERWAARFLFSLPPRVLLLLSGGKAIRVDGQTLCPELQLMLRMQRIRRGRVALAADTVEEARSNMRRDVLAAPGPEVPVGGTREVVLEGVPVPLRARHYAPATSPVARPLLVFVHGGGFVLGDLDTHDAACRMLCRTAQVHVLAVDYRLAPEHPFPAAIEDALHALKWAQRWAGSFGADPTRVALGGDSAGATLTSVAVQHLIERGEPLPCMQLLIYPGTDRVSPHPSLELFGKSFYLTRDDMRWFDRHYLVRPDQLYADPRVSPMLAPSLAGAPPTLLVTAGFDPLRDEGEAYGDALRAAGVRVESWREPELLHGFVNMLGISRTARRALEEIAIRLRSALEELAVPPRVGTRRSESERVEAVAEE